VDNGTQFDWTVGLRLHHAMAGAPADNNGQVCADCHNDVVAPSPENYVPVYYARSDVNVKDPCDATTSAGEDYDSDGLGLDNDGDLLYDGSDPDCGSTLGADDVLDSPTHLALLAPSPHPVPQQGSTISFWAPARGMAHVSVYDLAGRIRWQDDLTDVNEGWNAFRFDLQDNYGRQLPDGVYLMRVVSGSAVARNKIVIMR
jgi:hypothetical protein